MSSTAKPKALISILPEEDEVINLELLAVILARKFPDIHRL
jgi:hypothetical protein